MTFDIAPEPVTRDEFNLVLSPILNAAEGLGMFLATLPAENGWDQASFFDHDAGDELMSIALANFKQWAASSQKFYNQTKLEDAISQALVEAYSRGFAFAKEKLS